MSEGSASTREHREKAKSIGKVGIAVITVSDTRTPETDVNMQWLREEITKLGHELTAYRLIQDEPAQVEAVLEELAAGEARILLWNGGTGIFRMLSYEVVGAAAMLSRATAGVYKGKLVISTPGSPNAVQLAWTKLIAPEMEHLAWEVIR
jgi:molybdopterin adenylyltransferase